MIHQTGKHGSWASSFYIQSINTFQVDGRSDNNNNIDIDLIEIKQQQRRKRDHFFTWYFLARLARLVVSVVLTCRADDQSPLCCCCCCCEEMETGRYNKVLDWSHHGAKLSPLVKTRRASSMLRDGRWKFNRQSEEKKRRDRSLISRLDQTVVASLASQNRMVSQTHWLLLWPLWLTASLINTSGSARVSHRPLHLVPVYTRRRSGPNRGPILLLAALSRRVMEHR